MVMVQALPTLVVRFTGAPGRSRIRAAALACFVSVISGFFDGGIGNGGLTPALSAYRVFLLVVTPFVGGAGDAARLGVLAELSRVISRWSRCPRSV